MKKIIAIIVTSIAIVITLLIFLSFNRFKLKELGYSKEEINYISDNLKRKEINDLVEIPYDENIMNILKNENYEIKNMKDYLSLINEYNLNAKNAIYYINNKLDIEFIKNVSTIKNYNVDNIIDYYNFKQKHDIKNEYIVYLVNNDIEYTDEVINFSNEKYFVIDNLNRYLAYNKGNLSYASVIKLINSNRDKNFYTDIVSTDLSKNYLLIVNKYYALDKNYVPSNLVSLGLNYTENYCKLESTTYNNFKKLVDDAKKEGLNIKCRSGYRSYNDQNYIYNDYVKNQGFEWANQYSARPGHSEHQTGLAVDVTASNNNYGTFVSSKEYIWMVNNAHKYGFILRYLNGEENITGYNYESWHYRYVGVEAATIIHNEKLTFEEYYEYYVK